jgi:tetratricopeptide (TPR) repeat protein
MTDAAELIDLTERARALTVAGRQQDALRILRQVLAQDPRSGTAHCLAATCLLQLGNLETSLAEAELGVQADPTLAWPHILRSWALGYLARFDDAIEAAQLAVRLEPNNADCHETLSTAFLNSGNTEQAVTAARQAVSLAPGSADAWVILSAAALGDRDWEQAEAAATKALQIQPDSSNAMNNLGAALAHRRRTLLALSFFRRGLAADPTAVIVRGNINGLVLRLVGVIVCAATSLAILWMFASGRNLTGLAAVTTSVLIIVSATVLIVSSVGIPIWYHRLPQSVKRSLRDRPSWGAAFHADPLSRFGLALRLGALPVGYVMISFAVTLLVMAFIQGLPGGSSRNGGGNRVVLGIGLALGVYLLGLRKGSGSVRNKRLRQRPRPPRRVPVDWH